MKLKQCLCVFLSLLFAVSLAGCREKTDPIYEQTIQYNLESEPSSLDPQIADDQSAQIVIMSLFEGLTRIGPDGEAQPGVAERWEHNGDYTAFTFYLREDACWTDEDETPVTAADFVFAFRRALNPGTGSDLGRTLTCIANGQQVLDGQADPSELGVTALDSKTLKIDLAYSYEDFPKLMASSAAMPCNENFHRISRTVWAGSRHYPGQRPLYLLHLLQLDPWGIHFPIPEQPVRRGAKARSRRHKLHHRRRNHEQRQRYRKRHRGRRAYHRGTAGGRPCRRYEPDLL